jgi:hypothetical protein
MFPLGGMVPKDAKRTYPHICRKTKTKLWETTANPHTEKCDLFWTFFLLNGGAPSLCIETMHMAFINLLCVPWYQYLKVTYHRSHRLAAWISQRKIKQVWWYIMKWVYCATATRTGVINPMLPSPTGCTQNPSPPAAPLVGDRTTYVSNG